jgi:alkylresorcinol/alkylpyrone synthase
MGWEFRDQGFKVIFSQDIPSIISSNILADVSNFLAKHDLTIAEISNFIFHPGGKKILTAYEETLTITEEQLLNTRNVMNDYGNMSSPTVLYVMERFYRQGFENGFGLMLSMGPGFSSEMVLLKMENK